MNFTESKKAPLGSEAPSFNLLDTTMNVFASLEQLKSDTATVILFICNHCPFVKHINKPLVKVARTYQEKGVSFIAISSNDVHIVPEDSPSLMAEVAKKEGYSFPYLYDEDQSVAKAYGAQCTPDLFVYDAKLKLAYRGRFDETRPNGGTATGADLMKSLDELLNTGKCTIPELPSIGCSIKWKQ